MTLENRNDDMEARITAYALGELEGGELAAMEAAMAADPLLALRVGELRAFGDELGAALATEPVPVATPSAPARERVLRFPTRAWIGAGFAAAAGVAVMVALRDRQSGTPAEHRAAADTVTAPAPVPTPVQVAGQTAEPPPSPLAIPEAAPPQTGSEPKPELNAPRMVERPPAPAAPPAPVGAPSPEDDDKTLLARDSAATATTPVLPPVPAPGSVNVATAAKSPVPPIDPGAEVQAMLDKGRSQYAAGDLDGAAAVFDAVKKIDAGNRQAGYFSARIEQDRGRGKSHSGAGGHGTRLLRVPVSSSVLSAATVRSTTSSTASASTAPKEAVAEAEFVDARSEPVSTFAIDVDTGSYSEIRRSLLQRRRLPAAGTVRIEELINYFPYDYAPPSAGPEGNGAAPFATHLAVASAPWARDHRLVRIAIKGAELSSELRPAANLVFLVDVSGSMGQALSLVRFSLGELLGRLRPDDRVAIVTFEQKASVLLPSTPAARGEEIRAAIKQLTPKGGTNGGDGIRRAYAVAAGNFQPEGVNRVILCTDGLFNIGVTGREELLSLIREEAARRVYLTALGFGSDPGWFIRAGSRAGLREDNTLELLADNGNGVYGYVDSAREARKILVEQVSGTLATIAKDVKVQVAFNPAMVESYRLIGYENRALSRPDFDDDAADAGEIGAGHTITALYEVVPTDRARQRTRASAPSRSDKQEAEELLTVRIRHQTPEGATGRQLDFTLIDDGAAFEDADADFRFAAAVAAWGMLLREGGRSELADFADVQRWAEAGLGADPAGYRAEFVELVKRSRQLRR